MKDNYNVRYDLKRSSTEFLNYILETVVGNREPVRGLAVTSEVNRPGVLADSIKGLLHKGAPEISSKGNEISLKILVPIGVEGSINYISLIAGTADNGQIIETFQIPEIEKLSNISIELTLILQTFES